MAFDWLQFLNEYKVDYVERGANVARGHVNIRCPFCGDDDPSQHLGLELSSGRWGCFRDRRHRGAKPSYLIARLLGVSQAKAKQIAGEIEQWGGSVTIEDLRAAHAGLDDDSAPADAEPIELLPEFRKIESTGVRKKFYKYLTARRGFNEGKEVDGVIDRYDLRCCLTGSFSQRIILPIYQFGKLRGWTGRAIGKAEIRYRSHPPGNGLADVVYNEPNCKGGDVLIVVEGPFDAINIDWHTSDEIGCVAMLSTARTLGRIATLYTIAQRYNRVVVMFDKGAARHAYDVAECLQTFGAVVREVSGDASDPGDMRREDVQALENRLLWGT